MKPRPTKAIVAAFICLFLFAGGQVNANPVNLLGEQDFPDGAVVNFDSVWLSAQSNESGPSLGLYGSSNIISYIHSDLDPGLPGILSFSLWDLDSSEPGNQVSDFWLDGVPQPISQFETGRPAHTVELFQFPVAASFLTDGEVQNFFRLGPRTGNFVGLDFSRLEVIPEPASVSLAGLGSVLLTSFARRRNSFLATQS
jgi:hypothetical protein